MPILERARWLWIAVAVVVGSACGKPPDKSGDLLARLDCPGQTDTIWIRDDATVVRPIQTMPVAGNLTHIPEFHDCQKFPVAQPDAFGPLVGIWASDKLTELFDPPAVTSERAGQERAKGSQLAQGPVVAQIYDWGAAYQPLHIQPGFNCLYVWPTNPAQTAWKAKMIARGAADTTCAAAVPTTPDPLTDLEARALPNPGGLGGGDIPAVARWDWDFERSEQYAGIRCGDHWCEVGRERFVSSHQNGPGDGFRPKPMPDHPGGPATPTHPERVWLVKGWYDEQRVAVPKVGPAAGLKPAKELATVFPHPQLAELATVDAFAGRWMPSATVHLRAGMPTYADKLKLTGEWNTIYLCREGGGVECARPAGKPAKTCAPDRDGNTWYAKVEPEGGRADFLCVMREDHSGVATIEATARWRWVNHDETIWIRCAMGCCTLS